jgi:hypothetical protein
MKPIYILVCLVVALSSCKVGQQNAQAYVNQGAVHIQNRDYASAIADLDHAI